MPKRGKGGKKSKKSKLAYAIPASKKKLPTAQQLYKNIPYRNSFPIFSFQYFEHKHKHTRLRGISEIKDFYWLFERLQALSNITWLQMEQDKEYHAHPIEDWSRTRQKNNFKHLGNVVSDFPAFQFKPFKECRIIGFFKGAVFHIVWIDRKHWLYP